MSIFGLSSDIYVYKLVESISKIGDGLVIHSIIIMLIEVYYKTIVYKNNSYYLN
jgi:hypothetical protein